MSNPNLLTEIDAGIGIVTLNQPDRHNSLDDAMIAELTEAMGAMGNAEDVRLVVISSTGQNFCAGANPHVEPLDDGALAGGLSAVAECPKPVIARVQGAAYGAGLGLVAACDMAVASFDAKFSLPEVKFGRVPAAIAPHVMAAMGERHARRYLMTGEIFSAAEAYRIGLIHEMVADEAGLDAAIGEWVETLLNSPPLALAGAKVLIGSPSGKGRRG